MKSGRNCLANNRAQKRRQPWAAPSRPFFIGGPAGQKRKRLPGRPRRRQEAHDVAKTSCRWSGCGMTPGFPRRPQPNRPCSAVHAAYQGIRKLELENLSIVARFGAGRVRAFSVKITCSAAVRSAIGKSRPSRTQTSTSKRANLDGDVPRALAISFSRACVFLVNWNLSSCSPFSRRSFKPKAQHFTRIESGERSSMSAISLPVMPSATAVRRTSTSRGVNLPGNCYTPILANFSSAARAIPFSLSVTIASQAFASDKLMPSFLARATSSRAILSISAL
jgi:hypothetical protein